MVGNKKMTNEERRRMIVGIMFDETISRLSVEIRMKDSTFQEIKKIERKHFAVAKKYKLDFNTTYDLANEAWCDTQRKFTKNGYEFSNVQMLKEFIEREPWLVGYFDLNLKKFDKLYAQHNLTEHIFRTKKIVSTVSECVDKTLAQFNYRESA